MRAFWTGPSARRSMVECANSSVFPGSARVCSPTLEFAGTLSAVLARDFDHFGQHRMGNFLTRCAVGGTRRATAGRVRFSPLGPTA